MKRFQALVLVALLALMAVPAAAQDGFSIGPTAGILKITGEDTTFLRFGASTRLSLFRLLALRLDAHYMILTGDEMTWADASAGLELPILLGIYAKAQGGIMLPLGDKGGDPLPFVEAGVGFRLAGFFVEGAYSLLFDDGDSYGAIGAAAGFRFKL